MNWKFFLPLPLAALIVGHSLVPPRLAPPIPSLNEPTCNYPEAVHSYLLAYAYAKESPGAARQFLWAAENYRLRCMGDTSVLEERVQKLRASLP